MAILDNILLTAGFELLADGGWTLSTSNQLVRVRLTGADGVSAPRYMSQKVMVQVFWLNSEGRFQRILRYICYSVNEGIALAKWLHQSAEAVDIREFAEFRTP